MTDATPPAGIDDAPEPAVPVGMKAYGPDHPDYPNAPGDWGGRHSNTLLRNGMAVKGGSRWSHYCEQYPAGTEGTDIIAYTPIAGGAGIDDDPPGDMTAVSKDGGGDERVEAIAKAMHEADPDVGCSWEEWCAYADAHPDHQQGVDFVRRQARAVAALSAPPPVVDTQVVADAIKYAKGVLVRVFEKRGKLHDGVLASNVNIATHRLADALQALSTPVSQPIGGGIPHATNAMLDAGVGEMRVSTHADRGVALDVWNAMHRAGGIEARIRAEGEQ